MILLLTGVVIVQIIMYLPGALVSYMRRRAYRVHYGRTQR